MRTRILSRFNRFTVVAVLLALLASAVYVTPARAAAIVVNTSADSVNSGNGLCSLREAIIAANTNSASGPGAGECAAGSAAGVDTISFAGNYTITLAAGLGQLPVVTSAITVNGNGAANTVIQAHASPNTATIRVFYVDSGGNLTLNGVSVRNGRCNGSCSGAANNGGGGILSFGTLTVTNSVIAANSASGLGGGIYNLGTLTVTNGVFSGNSGGGGGISSSGGLTVTNSTFAGNTTPSLGGGIYSTGTLTVANSTFSGNTAGNSGGGIFHSTSAIANLTNSTFSGNSANLFGGGIHGAGESTLVVTNSTFSGNSAGSGGGINTAAGAGTVTLKNTVVANSTAGGNCGGTITNGGNNIDSGLTCGWGSNNGSRSNTDPKLGALASNGGPTQTMALLAGSPAIDTAAGASCPAADQRGIPRPQGSQCDIGAYELAPRTSFPSGGPPDGWVLETSESSNQGGTINATAATLALGDDAGNRQFRAILSFNTASLPDNAVVIRVILRIKKHSVTGTDPFTTHLKIAVDIHKGVFSNSGALQATDFQAAANKPDVGLIPNNPQPGGWYAVRLSPAAQPYVNLTGPTQLRLRFQLDDDNDAATDFIRFYSGNAAAATDRPVLVIEYYVP